MNKINLDKKCKICDGELVVRIYKNKAKQRQQGLYCSMCGKYNKFLTNDEVFYCAGKGYKIINTFGSLLDTKLKNLKYKIDYELMTKRRA